MRKFKLSFFALLLSTATQATTIGNGPPNQTGGSDLNAFLAADDFTIGAPFDITSIRFWVLRDNTSYTGTIVWSINAEVSGVPGTALFSGSASPTAVNTGNVLGALTESYFDIPVTISNLGAGTYWLVLHNGPNNAAPAGEFYWAWQNESAGNSQGYDVITPGPWSSNFAELAFQVTGNTVVPEPGTIGLTGLGAIAALWFARRKR